MSTSFEISRLRTLARHALPKLIETTVIPAFVLSVMLGPPLAQRIAADFCPIPPHVMADARVRRCFLAISLLWAVTCLVNASVSVWLQFTQSVGTYVVTRSLTQAALTVVAVGISVVWFKRSVNQPAHIPALAPVSA